MNESDVTEKRIALLEGYAAACDKLTEECNQRIVKANQRIIEAEKKTLSELPLREAEAYRLLLESEKPLSCFEIAEAMKRSPTTVHEWLFQLVYRGKVTIKKSSFDREHREWKVAVYRPSCLVYN